MKQIFFHHCKTKVEPKGNKVQTLMFPLNCDVRLISAQLSPSCPSGAD